MPLAREQGIEDDAGRYRSICTGAVSSTPVAMASTLLGPQYGDVG